MSDADEENDASESEGHIDQPPSGPLPRAAPNSSALDTLERNLKLTFPFVAEGAKMSYSKDKGRQAASFSPSDRYALLRFIVTDPRLSQLEEFIDKVWDTLLPSI